MIKTMNPKPKKLETKVTKLLDKAKVKYKTLSHKTVFTAHDAAQTTKKKLGEIAKVVLIKVDGVIARSEATRQSTKKIASDALAMTNRFILVVLPAGKYVDFKGIKKALEAKKVSIAPEKDIAKYLKTKVGLLHPFGNLYKLPPHPALSPSKGARRQGLMTLLDKSLAKTKKMVASAGTYTDSVEIALKDFEKLVKPIKGVFSKARK